MESGDAVYAMKCFWVNTWASGDEEGGGLSISSFNWNSILSEFWAFVEVYLGHLMILDIQWIAN